MRSKTVILLGLALGCGLVASIGISQVLRNQQPAAVEETAPVWVAMADIKSEELLSAQNLKLEQWPKEKIPQGSLNKLEDVDGKRLRAAVYQGEPILEQKLAGHEGTAGSKIPKGFRLYTVQADGMSSHGGLLHPGDRVDLLLFITRGNSMMDASTKTILQDVRVFAVNDVIHSADDKAADSIMARTVTLLVTPGEAEKAALASEVGKIRLVMRAPDDEAAVLGPGTSMNQLLTPEKVSRDVEDMNKPVPTNIKQATLAATMQQYAETVSSLPPTQPPVVEDLSYKMQIIKGTEVSLAEFHKSEEDPNRWSNGTYTILVHGESKTESPVAPLTQPTSDANSKSSGLATKDKDSTKPTGPTINPLAKTPGHG